MDWKLWFLLDRNMRPHPLLPPNPPPTHIPFSRAIDENADSSPGMCKKKSHIIPLLSLYHTLHMSSRFFFHVFPSFFSNGNLFPLIWTRPKIEIELNVGEMEHCPTSEELLQYWWKQTKRYFRRKNMFPNWADHFCTTTKNINMFYPHFHNWTYHCCMYMYHCGSGNHDNHGNGYESCSVDVNFPCVS